MISRFKTLLLAILVVSISLYIVLLNQERVTIYLDPSSPILAHVGVVMIIAFTLGLFVMALVALGVGFKYYLRERSLLTKDRENKTFYQNMGKARSFQASGNWEKAKDIWEKAIKKDPTDVIARVELSKVIQSMSQAGDADLLDALRVIDAARANDPKNVEVLYRAVELNLALNNKTAALDNLALITFHQPNKRVLELARNLSEDLNRLSDAIEYQKKLREIGGDTADWEVVNSRLAFKEILVKHQSEPLGLKDSLRTFLKKNGDYAPALEKLSELEQQSGKSDDAAQLLVRAAKCSGSVRYWHFAARLWIKAHTPEKAIAAARNATNDSSGESRIEAEIELLRVYVALGMLDQARQLCDGIPFLLKREAVSMSAKLQHSFLALKGLCLCRMGEYRQTAETLRKLCHDDPEMSELINDIEAETPGQAPAPRLSTP